MKINWHVADKKIIFDMWKVYRMPQQNNEKDTDFPWKEKYK